MRTQSNAVRPAYRISRGISGIMPMGVNITQINSTPSGTGNHIGLRAGPSGFTAWRVGTTRISRPDGRLDPNTLSQAVLAQSIGMEPIWFMANASDVTFASDPAGWETYIRASLGQAIEVWGASGVRFVEFRNEPSGVAAAWGSEVAAVYAIVKSVLPNCIMCGPVQQNLGFTIGRDSAGSTLSVAQYLSNGGTAADGIDFHLYPANDTKPEISYAHETLWLTETAKNFWSTSNLKMILSEWGYQTLGNGPGYVAGGELMQGKYWARQYFIHRAAECNQLTGFWEESDGGGLFGLYNTGGVYKSGAQMQLDAMHACQSWRECASYSRGIQKLITFTNDSQLYGQLTSCPWYVRGTRANGDEELAVWHASRTSWADQVIVYNPTGAAQTLTNRLVGTSTTTQSVAAGLTTLNLTLTDQPQLLSGPGLRFPEFQN